VTTTLSSRATFRLLIERICEKWKLKLKPEREGPLQVFDIGKRRLLKEVLKILDGKV
jgi:hypothetical protein